MECLQKWKVQRLLVASTIYWYNTVMPYKDPEVRKKKHREYSKQWRKRNPEWKDKRKEYPSYKKQYSQKSLVAASAHRDVYMKIKRGEIKRPDTCSRCKEKGFIEASHTSYEKRTFVWLCRPCHRSKDAKEKNGANQKLLFPEEIDGRSLRFK